MIRRIKKNKKNKIKYNFICQDGVDTFLQHLGDTDNPCRTTASHWTVFKNEPTKHISFDINFSAKKYEFDYNLELIEKNYKKTYKYNGEIINREKFILLLGCET